jgi:hypothetical protein
MDRQFYTQLNNRMLLDFKYFSLMKCIRFFAVFDIIIFVVMQQFWPSVYSHVFSFTLIFTQIYGISPMNQYKLMVLESKHKEAKKKRKTSSQERRETEASMEFFEPRQKDRGLALAMGLHRRLGAESAVQCFNPDLMRLVFYMNCPPLEEELNRLRSQEYDDLVAEGECARDVYVYKHRMCMRMDHTSVTMGVIAIACVIVYIFMYR